jgi:peptidoglycan-associated lipoprotein
MERNRKKSIAGMCFLGISLLGAGCSSHTPVATRSSIPTPVAPELPPPPPPATPEIVEFKADRTSSEPGQPVILSWQVRAASDVRILPDPGQVGEIGSRSVSPEKSSEYKLIAKGPGGEVSATVHVNVSTPKVARAPTPQAIGTVQDQLSDIQFDYDQFRVRDEARAVLEKNAVILRGFLAEVTGLKVLVEGHCDERGSAEYNMAMGARRAEEAMRVLVDLGVPGAKLNAISYGSEMPLCTDANEECWQRNRRVHLALVLETANQGSIVLAGVLSDGLK